MSVFKLVHEFLINSTENNPDKVCIIHEKHRITYKEITARAKQLANHLVQSGIKNGDRVVLIHENSVEYVVSYYGILLAGGVVVSLNPGTQPEGLLPLFEELQPSTLIFSFKVFRTIRNINSFPPSLKNVICTGTKFTADIALQSGISFFEDFSNNPETLPEPIIDENDLAAIIYTSGSTGKPKGVMLTHKNIVANTNSICSYLRLTENDIQMVVLPFFYVMGKSLLNTHIAVGGTVVINNKFAFPATVVNQMIQEKCTGFSGVPSTFAYLLHRSPLASSREQLTSLRYVSQAGGHMAKQVKLALKEILPNHTDIVIMYGATEASARLTWLDPRKFIEKIDSIGKAIPGVTITILDSEGRSLPPHQTGEITASGDNIMQGYWKNSEATEKVLDSNGYHTGDLGYIDDDGFIFITGRRDNQLKVGGHRVDPQEIEDTIMTSNMVVETAVIGLPDDLLGNKLYCLAVPQDGEIKGKSILMYASENLPKHKIPSELFLIKTLPKNASGKIDRAACAQVITRKLIEMNSGS